MWAGPRLARVSKFRHVVGNDKQEGTPRATGAMLQLFFSFSFLPAGL